MPRRVRFVDEADHLDTSSSTSPVAMCAGAVAAAELCLCSVLAAAAVGMCFLGNSWVSFPVPILSSLLGA
jgi:hypothetical protein